MPWPMIVAFLSPALILYTAFVLYPIVQSTRYSLYDWNGLESLDNFVGLDNFRRAFSDSNFTDALRHNVILIVSRWPPDPAALGLAVLLNEIAGRGLLRTCSAVRPVRSGDRGRCVRSFAPTVCSITRSAGEAWCTSGWPIQTLCYSLSSCLVKYFGFHGAVGGLQQIPKELGEAAAIDGATGWQRFRYVTLPLLGPTLRVSIFLSMIGALQLFDLVWVTTRGGPIGSSSTMATYLYDQFRKGLFGRRSIDRHLLAVARDRTALPAVRPPRSQGVALADHPPHHHVATRPPRMSSGWRSTSSRRRDRDHLPLSSPAGGFRSNHQLVVDPAGLPIHGCLELHRRPDALILAPALNSTSSRAATAFVLPRRRWRRSHRTLSFRGQADTGCSCRAPVPPVVAIRRCSSR
jgi:raffinose/stachyose/melibiose transport system permease protein